MGAVLYIWKHWNKVRLGSYIAENAKKWYGQGADGVLLLKMQK